MHSLDLHERYAKGVVVEEGRKRVRRVVVRPHLFWAEEFLARHKALARELAR